MHSLNKLGLRFLKKSKALTISSIISIFFTTIVLIFIFNYYQIVQNGYLQKLKENYGDSDLIVTLPNDLDIEEKWIEEIEEINGIEQVAIGQCGETNLNDVSVFTVGVADSEMNKGRYQYHSNMTGNRIIINQKVAEEFQIEIGDEISFGEKKLEVSEILLEDRFSKDNDYMAIVSQENLCEYLGKEIKSNYLLIKKEKRAKSDTIIIQLAQINSRFEVLSVEGDTQYQESLTSFRFFLNILVVIVVCVGGLLIASVFQSFLKKYMGDMMILKTIGGNQKQVQKIFMTIAVTITGGSCLVGLLAAIMGGNVLFTVFANKMDISSELAIMDMSTSIKITVMLFVILNFFLYRSITKFAKELPLKVGREQGQSGKSRKRKNGFLVFVENLLSKDAKIAFRLLVPKMRENMLLILTITMITLFSYVCDGVLNLSITYSKAYYDSLYLSDVLVSNGNHQDMEYKDLITIYEALAGKDENAFYVTDVYADGNYQIEEIGGINPSASITPIDMWYQNGKIKVKKADYSNCVILSKDTAEILKSDVGEYCTLTCSNQEQAQTIQLEVVGIIDSQAAYGSGLIILDENNSFYPLEQMASFTPKFFLSKNNQEIENTLVSLRYQYANLNWNDCDTVVAQLEQTTKQYSFMIKIVLYSLTILAGFGWLNSTRNMILSRKSEYAVLRKLGMTEKRVRNIIWRQVFWYLMAGIFLGVLLGIVVVTGMDYRESEVLRMRFQYQPVLYIGGFMLLLTIFLQKLVRKIATYRNY